MTTNVTMGLPTVGEALSAHKKPSAFLKALLLRLDSEQCRELHANLATAERDERCIRRAMFLMIVLLMLSVAGLGYCAILLPEVFHQSTHPVMRSLSALGLGSLISQAVFLGCLFWHRAGVTRLHEECRRLILGLARSQLGGAATPSPDLLVLGQSPLKNHENHPSIPGAPHP
jgi:hypothetical protein